MIPIVLIYLLFLYYIFMIYTNVRMYKVKLFLMKYFQYFVFKHLLFFVANIIILFKNIVHKDFFLINSLIKHRYRQQFLVFSTLFPL